ncbi:polyhydroxyalkanoate depolymerase [Roseicella aquatilis]|uniref:polyhydroxyalkanoate depolymerase n=1 Tax=Roseicella aquatilis TaxID=2527868 RepID=UPI0014052E2A|nr:polyhydroxyalkanoate depolymerase [Roseicella aquatilis]
MLYEIFEAQEAWLARLRPFARSTAGLLRGWHAGEAAGLPLHPAAVPLHLLEEAGTTHRKPAFGLPRVREEVVAEAPFGRLLRFARPAAPPGPRLLVVAPLSGHFATRLRGTVAALLPDHDLHVTDWTDAREVPAARGGFGLDEQVAQLIAWLEAMGPGTHLLTVSQPAIAALAAAALMAEDLNPARPRSLTLIAGPIDPHVNPTREAVLARALPPAWLATAEVATVPPPFAGAGRRVRPGAQQITASLLADLPAQLAARLALVRHLAAGDAAAVEAHRHRQAELRAVMDIPAELYLDTLHRVFRTAELARGRMTWRGRTVRPAAIRDMPLLAVEGEADATCPPGQTAAALDLCAGLPPGLRHHHRQPGARHDDLFDGPVWEAEIRPRVGALIRAADRVALGGRRRWGQGRPPGDRGTAA